MKKLDAALVVLATTLAVVAMIVAVAAISITITAAIAMLVCNWALPLFDIDYPITFIQGCGIGVIVIAIRAIFSGINVKTEK